MVNIAAMYDLEHVHSGHQVAAIDLLGKLSGEIRVIRLIDFLPQGVGQGNGGIVRIAHKELQLEDTVTWIR